MENNLYIIEKGKYPKKRKAIKVICDYCDKEFLKAVRFIKNNQKNYCCPEHSSLARKERILVKCAYCGKEKEITQSKYKLSKTKTFFCCREHQNKAQMSNNEIDYICNYTDGICTYRKLAFDNYKHECANCSYDEHIEILEVHHIDSNRKNNELKNLIILCPNCHRALTLKFAILEDGKIKWL